MQIRRLKTFSFLILAFILPLLMSWIFFYYHDYFSFKTTQHGTLVNPPFNVQRLWGDEKKMENNFCDRYSL